MGCRTLEQIESAMRFWWIMGANVWRIAHAREVEGIPTNPKLSYGEA